ncbi:hypothetical protein AYO45_04650 [Gammaproteobacteria bacterium SCGC AG-212-F23]|nr:hypothetical protein AYO45_04650 [Gammaproteobacteria bacterium SCGC AG-212-F23]
MRVAWRNLGFTVGVSAITGTVGGFLGYEIGINNDENHANIWTGIIAAATVIATVVIIRRKVGAFFHDCGDCFFKRDQTRQTNPVHTNSAPGSPNLTGQKDNSENDDNDSVDSLEAQLPNDSQTPYKQLANT